MNKKMKYEIKSNDGWRDIINNETGEYLISDASLPVDNYSEKIIKKLNQQETLIDELYMFRLLYNSLLFNEWYKNKENNITVYKSRKHNNQEYCFNGEWFIVIAILPTSKQITNHYHNKYWDYFKIPEYEYVIHEYDNHTPQDVIKRLTEMIK